MGRAFEYRKARKMKRWGHMARVFTKLGKEIEIAVKAAGPDPSANTRLRLLIQNAKAAPVFFIYSLPIRVTPFKVLLTRRIKRHVYKTQIICFL